MLIMPFIFNSRCLFSVSEASDTSPLTLACSLFSEGLAASCTIYRQQAPSIQRLKSPNWLLLNETRLTVDRDFNYPAAEGSPWVHLS